MKTEGYGFLHKNSISPCKSLASSNLSLSIYINTCITEFYSTFLFSIHEFYCLKYANVPPVLIKNQFLCDILFYSLSKHSQCYHFFMLSKILNKIQQTSQLTCTFFLQTKKKAQKKLELDNSVLEHLKTSAIYLFRKSDHFICVFFFYFLSISFSLATSRQEISAYAQCTPGHPCGHDAHTNFLLECF